MSPDLRGLRAINRANVLNVIFVLGPISRARIARLSGLRKPTISSIVGELIDEGLVCETSLAQSGLGRKPVNLKINARYRLYGLIDVKLWKTELAVCDLSGKVLASDRITTMPGDPDAFLGACARRLAVMLEPFREKILGVSLILPCPLDSSRGFVYHHRTLGWNQVDVRSIVSAELDCPVMVENDARAAALAEMMFSPEARDLSSFVYVLVTDGIGMGTVIGGRLYYGAHYLDGRVGEETIPVGENWGDLSCRNSWEDSASLRGVVRRFREHLGAPAPRDISREMDNIIMLARAGDSRAIQAIKQTAGCLGLGLAQIYLGIDPERIIIGGELTRVWDLVIDEIATQVESQSNYHPAPLRDLIVPGSLRHGTFEGGRALILQGLFGGKLPPEIRGIAPAEQFYRAGLAGAIPQG